MRKTALYLCWVRACRGVPRGIGKSGLRARPEDIPMLSWFYLAYFSRKFNKSLRDVNPVFPEALRRCQWKGTVAARRNVIESFLLFIREELPTGEEPGLAVPPRGPPVPRAGAGNTVSFRISAIFPKGIGWKRVACYAFPPR